MDFGNRLTIPIIGPNGPAKIVAKLHFVEDDLDVKSLYVERISFVEGIAPQRINLSLEDNEIEGEILETSAVTLEDEKNGEGDKIVEDNTSENSNDNNSNNSNNNNNNTEKNNTTNNNNDTNKNNTNDKNKNKNNNTQ